MGWSTMGLMGWLAVGLMGLMGLIWEVSGDGFDLRLLGRSVWWVWFGFGFIWVWWVDRFFFFFFSHGFDWFNLRLVASVLVLVSLFWSSILMGLLGFKNMNSHVLGRTRRTVHWRKKTLRILVQSLRLIGSYCSSGSHGYTNARRKMWLYRRYPNTYLVAVWIAATFLLSHFLFFFSFFEKSVYVF